MREGAGKLGVATGITLVLVLGAWGGVAREGARIPQGPDLCPRPDALEYGLATRALVVDGRLAIDVGGVAYPPRYPPGFPILAAPFVAARGGDPAAVVDAAYAYGLLVIGLLAAIGGLIGGPLGAATAAAVGALSPGLVQSSVLGMSETASTALVSLLILGTLLARRWAGRRAAAAAALVAGCAAAMAIAIRITAVLAVPPLIVGLWRSTAPASRSGRWQAAMLLALPVLLAIAALLAFNAARFGSPFRDGYAFWVPEIYRDPGTLFSTTYVTVPYGGHFENANGVAYGQALLGLDGWLWTPAVLVLAGLGVVRTMTVARGDPDARLVLRAAVFFAATLAAFHLFYFWQDPRFFLPLVPFVAALAAGGADFLGHRLPRPSLRHGALTVLVPLAIAGDLSRALPSPAPADALPPLVTVLPHIAEIVPREALVLVNFPTGLARVYLPGRVLALLDGATSDPHVLIVAGLRLAGLDGTTPSIRALAAGTDIDQDALSWLVRTCAAYPVFVITAVGEGRADAALAALRQAGALEPVLATGPATVHRLRQR